MVARQVLSHEIGTLPPGKGGKLSYIIYAEHSVFMKLPFLTSEDTYENQALQNQSASGSTTISSTTSGSAVSTVPSSKHQVADGADCLRPLTLYPFLVSLVILQQTL